MTDHERAYLICVIALLAGVHGPWWVRVLKSQPDMRIVDALASNRQNE